MKQILYTTLVLLIAGSCNPPQADETSAQAGAGETASDESMYDADLAAELGADDYGMKSYVLAYLKRGPNRELDSASTASLMQAHLANIRRMAEMDKLVLAGPFLDGGDTRGIYIFDVESIAEAEALTNTDPAIREGYLVMELHPWYGSAALKQVNDIHARIARENP